MGTSILKAGFRFQCQRCSNCCRLDPGFVFLTLEDLSAFCSLTGGSKDQFIQRYCRWVPMNGYLYLSLREKPNYDCVFWEQGGCVVYQQRPLQCRSYPFWEPYLVSEQRWAELTESCPGIGKGDVHSQDTIQGWVEQRKTQTLIRTPLSTGGGT